MSNNRERAEQIILSLLRTLHYEHALDVIDAITAALDEAEKRGEAVGIARGVLQMPEIVQRPKS